MKKSLIPMRRISDFDFIGEEASNIGIYEIIQSITNLHEVTDGLYSVCTDNVYRGWESGVVDGYDLVLVPYGMKG